MAMLFDVETPVGGDGARAQRVLDDARAEHSLTRSLDHARAVGGRAGLGLLNGYRSRIAAVESEILADHVRHDGDTRRAERLLDDGKTSKQEQRRKANRAKAVGKNHDLAARLANGGLSEEQLDVIADAANKTDGDAAVDGSLIDKVAAMPPEQGRNAANDYVAQRATAAGVQTEHNRQRALRRAYNYHNNAKGVDSITLEGDGVSTKLAWDSIERRANEIYHRDGGRDLPHGQHPRTRDQRLYDATIELLTNQPTTPNGNTAPGEPDNTNPASETDTGDTGDKGTGSNATSNAHRTKTGPGNTSATPGNTNGTQPVTSTNVGKANTSATVRPRIVISLTIDQLLAPEPTTATQHGLGLIPPSVVANYAAHADYFTALYDRHGQPLWLGRLKRYATPTQLTALILRDNGCVLCGADHTKCQAHHTTPWHAPNNGRTDLTNLVLLCEPCHTRLHAEHQTLYQDHHHTWRTRPATPNEIPPPRPNTTRNTIHRE